MDGPRITASNGTATVAEPLSPACTRGEGGISMERAADEPLMGGRCVAGHLESKYKAHRELGLVDPVPVERDVLGEFHLPRRHVGGAGGDAHRFGDSFRRAGCLHGGFKRLALTVKGSVHDPSTRISTTGEIFSEISGGSTCGADKMGR